MAHINRKYIDSHWLIFTIRGVIALLFGWVALFSMKQDFSSLISLVGIFLLSLSIIEFINALHRAHQKTGWAVSVSLAVADAVVALALLFTLTQTATWHLYIVAAYTFLRGFFEIIAGFRTTVDPTDRFIWVLCGMCGAIMGIVVFNSGDFFVRFFGAYLIILGVCSLVYGVHNHAQKLEDRAARKESALLAAKTRKKHAKATKSAKKSRK
ncbi:DUF308 domain-containing protein [Candidatus Saccharibacteria bacterium]|nr:DUF308 domain-containing protein [Candidatus Saccharibacteria bacterium]